MSELSIIKNIQTILSLLENVGSARALVRWPKFSVTSFMMVSRLAKQGVSPSTVLDIGANVGQFSIASAKLFPNVRVHSFEPVPKCFDELRKNVSGLGNVVVYPLALGGSAGEISFHVNAYSHSSSALPLARAHREAFPEAQEMREIKVEITTLDRIFARAKLDPPVLLKLDVQGYEAQVLRGGTETLKNVDYVVLEASFKQMYEGELLFMDIVQLMEQQGFRFERPVGWLAVPDSGEILQMDALFIRDT